MGRAIRSGIRFDTARDLSNSEQDKEIEKQNVTYCHEFKLFRSDLISGYISMKLPFAVLRKSALKFTKGCKRENSISYYFL